MEVLGIIEYQSLMSWKLNKIDSLLETKETFIL